MRTLLMAGALLASTIASGESLVLTTEDAPPFNFTSDGGKTITGSATDIVRELFKRANVQYTITLYPWERAYNMGLSDKDTCVYSTTRTDKREPLFNWVGPVAPNDWMLFAKADSSIAIKSLDDARKYKIGGYRGDAVSVYLHDQKLNVEDATNDEQTAQKLQAGRIDLWATGLLGGPFVAKKMGIKIKPVFNIKKTELYLACSKSVPMSLVNRLNDTLRAMAKDGTVDKINMKYQ